jgi:predicted DNA-binding ribbon-helix-helix protein
MMVDLEDLGTTHIRRKSISCRKQKDTMKDREGLKSTISSGHGEEAGVRVDRLFWTNLISITGRRLMASDTGKP